MSAWVWVWLALLVTSPFWVLLAMRMADEPWVRRRLGLCVHDWDYHPKGFGGWGYVECRRCGVTDLW